MSLDGRSVSRKPSLAVILRVLLHLETHSAAQHLVLWTKKMRDSLWLFLKRVRCKRRKLGSSIKARHELDTQRNRRSDLTGSLDSISDHTPSGALNFDHVFRTLDFFIIAENPRYPSTPALASQAVSQPNLVGGNRGTGYELVSLFAPI